MRRFGMTAMELCIVVTMVVIAWTFAVIVKAFFVWVLPVIKHLVAQVGA